MIYKLLPTRVFRAYTGGKNLDLLEGKENPRNSRFPEDWLASVTTAFNPGRDIPYEGLSKTEEGEYLKDIIEADKEKMIGKRKEMSLLFKMLDSNERLVIQAHPTVEFAKKYFNSDFGKTECWYVLNDGGYVYIGFKEGITREYWKSLFEKQDTKSMLECLHKFEVKKGDFIFVSGGVPHAIGEGCFMAELQEPTDLMVIPERVTPAGVVLSEQKMHGGLGFDKMFDCFLYNGASREETRKNYFKNPKIVDECMNVIVDSDITDKFALIKIKCNKKYVYSMPSYAIALVTDGTGEINGISLKKGDRVFVSETEKTLDINGDIEIMLCMP